MRVQGVLGFGIVSLGLGSFKIGALMDDVGSWEGLEFRVFRVYGVCRV